MSARRDGRFRELTLPALALLGTIVFAVGLYLALVRNQQALLQQRTALALEVAERTIERGLRDRIEALARLGQRAAMPGVAEREPLFRAGARRFLDDFEGLIAVGWRPADGTGGIFEARDARWLGALAAPLASAEEQEPTIERWSGDGAIARLAVPEWDDHGRLVGHVLAAFRYGPLLDELLVNLPGGFELSVAARGENVYARPVAAPPAELEMYVQRRERAYFGEPLALSLWPSTRTATVFRSNLAGALLLLGVVIGLLFATSLRFFSLARARAREAEAALAKMHIEAEERERVQRTLADAHDELRRRNVELQDFAFAASHDLQEPLRKIRAFGDRLEAKYAGALEDTGRDYLARMQGAARRMQELIEALLEYSRVSSQARPMKPVDLNQIAHDVVADLETVLDEARAEVVLGALPMLVADPVHMRQLLQNLLSNAVKFRAPGRAPVVRVSAYPIVRDGKPWCRIVVADNGIGFDDQYADRIFAPFKRLHARDEFEGTGIGLAIVRRIVERHRGEISAHGEPGVGATFTIDMPAAGEPASADALKMPSQAAS